MQKRTRQKIEYRAQKKTWVGRIKYWDDESGKWARTPMTELGTDDEGLAQERYDAWLASGILPNAGADETFEAAARRIVRDHLTESEQYKKERMQRLEDYVFPVMGFVAVGKVKTHHVATVLDRIGSRGLSSGTQEKTRCDLSRLLGYLERKGVIADNPALGCKLGEEAEDDDRERVMLTDEEYLQFWRARGFERELDMMVLFSRCLGAHRTSDLHAADWSHFDRETWQTCEVRRPKTDDEPDARGRTRRGRRRKERGGLSRATRSYKMVTHRIPEIVREPLVAWWQKAGRPESGPVFPYVKGEKVGQRRDGRFISYAKAFRKAVWEAGIRRIMPGKEALYEAAIGDEARKKFCLLQTATEATRPLDFHGHRAAAITALCQAGVDDLTLMGIVGHSQIKTSAGYVRRRTLGMPAGALPGAAPPDAQPPGKKLGLRSDNFPPAPSTPSLGARRVAAREGAKALVLDVLAGVLSGDREALKEGR
jgi:integrase